MLEAVRARTGTSPGSSGFEPDCPVCGDIGYTVERDDAGVLRYRECECSVRKRNKKRIERSGLKDLLARCTMESYRTEEAWQRAAKESAEHYLADWRGKWFFIGGNSGSGKTHLCTAMCGKLMDAGLPVRYVQWRADIPALKAKINDSEAYRSAIEPLKTVKVLYIDDFLKGSVTEGDRNIAFDLLNARYIRTDCVTIISSELTVGKVLDWDEAIGSRIVERSREYLVTISGAGKNYRLRRDAR